MLKRFGCFLLVIALLSATGTYWTVLQSVAWTTMLANNLRAYSLSVAIQRTFDGKHPCPICCHIAEGKKSEKKTEFPAQLKRLEFPLEPQQFVLVAPQLCDVATFAFTEPLSLTQQPPAPPPRITFA